MQQSLSAAHYLIYDIVDWSLLTLLFHRLTSLSLLPQKKKMSGGLNSIDAVKKKIKVLQEQAEEAEDRAVLLQKEVEKEKMAREEVHTHAHCHTLTVQRLVGLVSLSGEFGMSSCYT